MKLELKHLAPYLPYELEIKYKDFSGTLLRLWQDKEDLHINCKNGIGTFINSKYPREFQPILKPITDLDILIYNEFVKYRKDTESADKEIIENFCEEVGVTDLLEITDLETLPYKTIEFMFKNHYDFFGLIEKGLAVSIHDVPQAEA